MSYYILQQKKINLQNRIQYGCSTREADGFAVGSFDVSVDVRLMAIYANCVVFPTDMNFVSEIHPSSSLYLAIRDVLNRHVGKTNLELFYQRFCEF